MISKKKSLLPTVILVGIAAFILLATVPPPGVIMTHTGTMVSATPNGLKTENTKIYCVRIPDPITAFAIFTATGQTATPPIGTNLQWVQVVVHIAKEYATDEGDAKDLTRVTVIIKDPEEATVFDATMVADSVVVDRDDYWEVTYWGEDTPHDLVEGTYTVTTKYEIYV